MLAEAGHPPGPSRSGLLVAGGAALPFVAGALLYAPTASDIGGPEVLCPFRAATGLPCPLCGSTRAIALAVHGDLGFVDYNAVVVLLLAAAVVAGLAAVAGVRWARGALARVAAAPVASLLVVVLVAWAWTLSHRATITG